MQKGVIDSAQWWLYEQTSFRQLSEIYRAEEFMGLREAHVRNEKEPPSALLPLHPCIPILHLLGIAPLLTARVPTPGWCRWAWHHPTEKIEYHLIMQPSCGKHGVCNHIDRRSSQNPLYEDDKVRREWEVLALATLLCILKLFPLMMGLR